MDMSKRIVFGWAFVALFPFSQSAQAYKEATHEKLSEAAVLASRLNSSPSLLVGLGLKPFSAQTFPNAKGEPRRISELVEGGAHDEDEFPRSRHHFFNPVRGEALVAGKALGYTSPDWAIEDRGQISGFFDSVAADQKFSYRDAQRYFYLGLTKSVPEDRGQNFGKMFQALGQVIHHVQDMAQPQHVRNDLHLDQLPLLALPGVIAIPKLSGVVTLIGTEIDDELTGMATV